MQFVMHGNTSGQHNFRLPLPTDDPKQPDKKLQVLSISALLHESHYNAGNQKISSRQIMLSVTA